MFQPVTQRFKLDDSTKAELKSMTPNFGFNGFGEIIFRRTYSRGNEDWADVVIRVIEGLMSIRKEHYTRNHLAWNDEEYSQYAREMALSLFDMEWMPPGRGLWMMGTEYPYTRGSMALFNCAATSTKDDLVQSAEWTMDALMNGVGVGFDVKWRGVATKPDKKDTESYVIPDSREGWVTSLQKLLCSYIHSKKYGSNKYPVFDYSQIRKQGEPIKGFGGVASGSEPLIKLHKRVEGYLECFCEGYIETETTKTELVPQRLNKLKKLRKKLEDTQLSDILDMYDTLIAEEEKEPRMVEVKSQVTTRKPYTHTRLVADIFNAIGACVVAGNVRRSAEICIGGVDDEEFINLKNYEVNPERQEIGWMSNNSVVLESKHNFEDFGYIPDIAKRIADNGEPGIINLYNVQKYGRMGKVRPDKASLVNPCSEIPLENFELCNLAETFPTRCKNPERWFKAIEYATFYASSVSLLPTHRQESNAVLTRNRRIGVSISGIAQWISGVFQLPQEKEPSPFMIYYNEVKDTLEGDEQNKISQAGSLWGGLSCVARTRYTKCARNKSWGDMNATKLTKFLRDGYDLVLSTNVKLANDAGVPASIRVTAVKPSGTISLLAGVTSGVHYPVSRWCVRRVRFGNGSELCNKLVEAGVPNEVDVYSDNTTVFSFLIDHGDVRSADEVSIWEQFEMCALMQRAWADNMVSATVMFKKEEVSVLEKAIAMFISRLKSVSLLPISDHNYAQPPYEKIDEETYNTKYSPVKLNFDSITSNVPIGSKFCTGDSCTLIK